VTQQLSLSVITSPTNAFTQYFNDLRAPQILNPKLIELTVEVLLTVCHWYISTTN
jgi:hypothetical protein